jgi:hypothetical protein
MSFHHKVYQYATHLNNCNVFIFTGLITPTKIICYCSYYYNHHHHHHQSLPQLLLLLLLLLLLTTTITTTTTTTTNNATTAATFLPPPHPCMFPFYVSPHSQASLSTSRVAQHQFPPTALLLSDTFLKLLVTSSSKSSF